MQKENWCLFFELQKSSAHDTEADIFSDEKSAFYLTLNKNAKSNHKTIVLSLASPLPISNRFDACKQSSAILRKI